MLEGDLTRWWLVRARARRRSRALVSKLDRPRRIDMFIDFFGEGPASVAIPGTRPAEAAASLARSRAEAAVQPVNHPPPRRARDPSLPPPHQHPRQRPALPPQQPGVRGIRSRTSRPTRIAGST